MPSFQSYIQTSITSPSEHSNIFYLERHPETKNPYRSFVAVVAVVARTSRRFNVCDVITLENSPRKERCWCCHSGVTGVEFSPRRYDVISATLEFAPLESYSELLGSNNKTRPLPSWPLQTWISSAKRFLTRFSRTELRFRARQVVVNVCANVSLPSCECFEVFLLCRSWLAKGDSAIVASENNWEETIFDRSRI